MTSLWLASRPHPHAAGPAEIPPGDHDVVVVGAGLTGLTTALLLARAGREVLVLEDRGVGAVTTGNTTGKVSLLQGTTLSQVRSYAGDEALSAYVTANREGQRFWVDTIGEGPDLQRRDAYSYATSAQGEEKLAAELAACRAAGLAVEHVPASDTELPPGIGASTALRLRDQYQMHPVGVLGRLVEELTAAGGVLVEGVRVTTLGAGDPCELSTSAGPVRARHVVLATGTPVLDRGLHFARLEPQRSYAASYRVPSPPLQGMYLSADSSTRSLRTVPLADGEQLVVGGNGHVVGRHRGPTSELVADLDAWTATHFPGAERVHAWSAQDYQSSDMLPIVGPVAGTDGRVLAATGYQKWGLAMAPAAAMALAGRLTGDLPKWAPALEGTRLGLRPAYKTGLLNLEVALHLLGGWGEVLVRAGSGDPPGEGEGRVLREGAAPVAVSRVVGRLHRVSAVCTHLGGRLRWNDAECSWDCPLHGSRFAADGTRLEGPATRDLRRH
jgi:glycine/D-amino acid oxidase-like deaminating enzyme/nitrite reductase/ring-hydroxylating ferredoxin subunit